MEKIKGAAFIVSGVLAIMLGTAQIVVDVIAKSVEK